MQKKFIKFGKPCILKSEARIVSKLIDTDWIGTGPQVLQFEKDFSKYKKTKYSLALNSCTAGLHLTLKSLSFKYGSEIITTPMTFCSTINSIIMSGYKPVLVDIRMDNFNIDERKIEQKITSKTKAILVVHFNGVPCHMDIIKKIAKKYNLQIIEDCAHAIETKYKGLHVGNFGVAGNFSFYANKNITTGEGGMLITKDKKLHDKIKILRLHGMSKDAWKRYTPDMVKETKKYMHYDVTQVGYKYNMIDLEAVLGISQLNRINSMHQKRKKIYNFYKNNFKNLPVLFQDSRDYSYTQAYHLFFMIFDKTKTKKKRDDLINFLNKNGIGASVHYRSITEMTIYKKKFNYKNSDFPNSYYVGQNTISLPLYPDLKKTDQNYIIKKVGEFFNV